MALTAYETKVLERAVMDLEYLKTFLVDTVEETTALKALDEALAVVRKIAEEKKGK